MKKLLLALAFAWTVGTVSKAQIVSGLNDLNYWGSGPNRAGIVIDWNDGKGQETLAWGLQWTGSLNLMDALEILAAADSRLFFRLDSSTSFGTSIFGVGYQVGNSPFAVIGAVDESGNPVPVTFAGGISDTNSDPLDADEPSTSLDARPINPEDHYVEGWNDNGFWSIYFQGSDNMTPTPGAAYPSEWKESWLGADSTPLIHDGWYALSITAADFSPIFPGPSVASIPEPSAILLLGLAGAIGVFYAKRRIHIG